MVVIHLCVKMSVFAVSMATASILKFPSLKTMDIPTKWIIIWFPNHGYQFPTSKSTWKPNFAQIGGFLYFGDHFGFKIAAIANQRWISIRNIIIYLETKFRPNRGIFLYGGHFVPWLPWQRPLFWIFPTSHTLRWIFLQRFMKFDERNPIFFKSPLFCFHGNCGKICPTDSDFFALSRSTRCGCFPIKFHQFLFGE